MSNEKFSTAEWGVKHIDTFCGEQGLGVIGSVVCLTIGDLVYPLGATGIQWGSAEQQKAYDTAVANAYLMRVAPNMYYLLDKCEGCIRKLLDGPVDDPVWGEAENTINEIRTLLEKARGER